MLQDFILAFMFLRLLFLVRAVANYSIYTDAYSKKIARQYGFTSGVRFALKCHLTRHPTTTVFVLFTFMVLILSYIMRIFELPYFYGAIVNTTSLENYFNAIWFTVVTITTVGYGDIVPRTQFG